MPEPAHLRQRASKRLRWSLPVLVDCDKTVYTANTEDLSSAGARLKVPVSLSPGTLVDVTNLQSGNRARFKVVWGSPLPSSDECYRLGVQMLAPSNAFWGFDLSSGQRPLGNPRPRGSLASQTLQWRKN